MRRGAARRGGFTLLELSVSLVLAALVLAISAQLLAEAQLAFVSVARESRAAAPEIAARRLRKDLRAARGLAGGSWVPSDGRLLVLRQEGWVSYELIEDRLVRTSFDLGEQPGPARTILTGVVGWTWRQPASGLIEIRADYREPMARLLRVRADLARPADEVRTIRLTVAPRGRRVGW